MKTENDILKINDICQIFGVSRQCIYNWIENKILEPIIINQKSFVRFRKEDIEKILKPCNEKIEKEQFYVYIYLDTRKPGIFEYKKYEFSFEPIYVGKGKNNRYKSHIENAMKQRISPFFNRIRQIKKDTGKQPEIKLYKKIDARQALNTERELINLIGRYDIGNGPLFNITEGGENNTFCKTEKNAKKESLSKNCDLGDEKIYRLSKLAKKINIATSTLKKWMISKECIVYKIRGKRFRYFTFGKEFKKFLDKV